MSFFKAKRIVETTCLAHGIEVTDLLGGRKTRTIAACRKACAIEIRRETTLSWSEIAWFIGRKSIPRTKEYVK